MAKRTFVPEDLYRLVQVGDPQMHPDGDEIAYVRSHVEGEEKEYRSHIWTLRLDEQGRPVDEGKPLTRGPRRDQHPRWSPDGSRLAFVRQIGDGPDADRQIWILDRDGGEAWPLTAMRRGATSFRWSPDGQRIAFVAPVGDDETDGQAAAPMTKAERRKEQRRALDEARHITRFQYKFDQGGLRPPARRHVWVVDVPRRPPAPGEANGPGPSWTDLRDDGAGEENAAPPAPPVPAPRRITRENFDHSLLDWSPDGRFVAVGASYEDEREPIHDVWIFPVPEETDSGDEPGEPVRLTGADGVFYEARWSPDGRRIAVVGHKRERRSATQNRLWLFPAPGEPGSPACVTEGWDRGLGGTVNSDFRPGMAGSGLTWDAEGGLLFVADDRGRTQLWRLPTAPEGTAAAGGGTPNIVLGGPAEIYGFSLSRDGRRAALAVADMFNPGDVYVAFRDERSPAAGEADGETPSDLVSELGWRGRRATAVNAALLADIRMPSVEEIEFPSKDGLPIHGWIMRPVPEDGAEAASSRNDGDQSARAKAPGVLQIHGGPHTCWGHSFSLEMHLQAAMGFAVVFVNPRGSTSYGQAFAEGVLDDYGGRDYEDLMTAVDYAVGLGVIDEARLAVTGGSYGGFMTNWIVTQTDRFRAAITHRSISNWISFWGVSDIGPRFMDGEFGAPSLWEGFDDMWERSPLKHARNVTTPLLICHSEHDLRCPMEQAEQFYVALKWEGKTVELLRHPRSNHDLTRTGPPPLRVDRFRHIARFLRRHVLEDGNA